jgi:hypothetical protein
MDVLGHQAQPDRVAARDPVMGEDAGQPAE